MKFTVLLRYLTYITSAAIPALFAAFLVRHYFGTSIVSFTPVWNDEIDYWHQILSYAQNGFAIGYYTVEEIPSPLSSVTGFGTHGPFFPILYGSVAKVTGWFPYSGPLFHMLFLSIAIFIFLALIRASLSTVLLATITLVLFLPIQMYFPSTMQEPLHYAFAIVLAGQFYRYMTDEVRSRWLLFSIPALLIIASLLRPTWSVLFIPYLFLTISAASQKSKALLLASGTVILGVFLFAYTLYSAPYPDLFIQNFFAAFNSSPAEGFNYFIGHFVSNLAGYFSLKDPFEVEKILRIQYIAAVIFVTINYFNLKKPGRYPFETLMHFCNLLIPLALVISLYYVDGWLDYRLIAPHVLFSIAFFSAQNKTLPCLTMLAISLLATPAFSETYKQFHSDHFQAAARDARLLPEQFSPFIKYRKDVTPWGNSLLIDMDSLQPYLVGLPAGIGINTVLDWNHINYPLKSAYVLIEPEIYAQISYKVRLRPIANSMHGTLYLNLDSPGLQ